jgi:hypothetical protein
MSDLLQRELEDICLRILRNSGEDTERLLNDTRALYEKIVVLHHQNSQRSTIPQEDNPMQSFTDTSSAREVPIPEGPPTTRSEEVAPEPEKAPEIEQPKSTKASPVREEKPDTADIKPDPKPPKAEAPKAAPKPKPKPSSGGGQSPVMTIKIGLNDRIAFVKKLFHNQDDDFNRVLSQINGFDNFEEAESFLTNLVVPEYGWNMEDEFTVRFINLVRMRYGLDEIPEE